MRRNRYIALSLGLAVGIVALVIGITPVLNGLFTKVNECPEGTVPTHHRGERRELLPIETDTTFPWDRQQAEVKEFYREFQNAVAADEREKVSSMMMYPLRVTFFDDARAADYRFLNSPDELLSVYDRVFHQTVTDYIAQVDPNTVWGNDYFLQTGTGQIGIYCTTHGDCPSCTFDFKVKIVRGNSIYRDATEDIFGNPLPKATNR